MVNIQIYELIYEVINTHFLLHFIKLSHISTLDVSHPPINPPITKTKYNHIKTGVYSYLLENPQYKTFRIDAISIVLKPELQIQHLKNI